MIICTAMLFIAEHFMPSINKAFVVSMISLLLSCRKWEVDISKTKRNA